MDEIKRLKMLIQQRDNEIMILLNLIKKNTGGTQQSQISMALGNANITGEVNNLTQNESKIITFPQYEQLDNE